MNSYNKNAGNAVANDRPRSRPAKGDRDGWREVFAALEWLEHQKLVVIERSGRSIESLILTDAGADRIRGKLDQKRGLLQSL